jgi:hypothetical protein
MNSLRCQEECARRAHQSDHKLKGNLKVVEHLGGKTIDLKMKKICILENICK